ncbi:hypothetical protein BS47DRAFT_1366685 [Hydnum rufescens UP504]|uniref:Uncharacterized protein n=1 Tax=Hydnum rufescens UP504 TaxID=1448309 RepID=A0A9P6DMY3_9AGAM|nr:hypothetical protein BS47DRAFT_1366685 [Hydnum rufescens UP504]
MTDTLLPSSQANAFKGAKAQAAALSRADWEEFNKAIEDLKQVIASGVDAIHNNFKSNGKKGCKRMSSITISHAEVLIPLLDSPHFPGNPYKAKYIELLRSIKSGKTSFEDIVNQETPEEEEYAKMLHQGLAVKEIQHGVDKLTSIATELNEKCSAEVLLVVTKGRMEDTYMPYRWASSKAQFYWSVLADQDLSNHTCMQEACTIAMVNGEITGQPNAIMAWKPHPYLQLVIDYGVEIDMMNYPAMEGKEYQMGHVNARATQGMKSTDNNAPQGEDNAESSSQGSKHKHKGSARTSKCPKKSQEFIDDDDDDTSM